MDKYLNNKLKDTFGPTPLLFTGRISQTLKTLPDRRARRRWPIIAAAAAAIATCAASVVLFNTFSFNTNDIVKPPLHSANAILAGSTAATPTTTPNGGPVETAGPGTYPANTPLPPVDPLPQLAVSTTAKAPSSADGWQAAAVSDDVAWYYNPSTAALARVEAGKTVAIALALAKGQTVDTYTFIPAEDGRWLAFTVHSNSGDNVWLITKDGRKMDILRDARWIGDNDQPVQIDFTGMSMIPYNNRLEIYANEGNNVIDALIDSINICAVSPDGTFNWVTVELDTVSGYQSFTLDDRRGYFYYGQRKLNKGETIVTNKYTMYVLKAGENGQYAIDLNTESKQSASLALQSNQFLLFKVVGEIGQSTSPGCALLVYKDDPGHTLWELDMNTGKAEKIASGCLTADWQDDRTYWFAAENDPATIHRYVSDIMNVVNVNSNLNCYIFSPDSNRKASTVALVPELSIQNHTDKDITIPDTVTCSLAVKKDGTVIWERKDSSLLTGVYEISLGKIGMGGPTDGMPVVVHPGCELKIGLAEIPYAGPGVYTLEGHYYTDNQIKYQIALPVIPQLPDGVSINAGLNPDGRLSVAYINNSKNDFRMLKADRQPPTIYYRLFSGDKEVNNGLLPMSTKPADVVQTVPSGSTYTLVEPGDTPKFKGLLPGQYRLECEMLIDNGDASLPWGFAGGYYFDVTFTIP